MSLRPCIKKEISSQKTKKRVSIPNPMKIYVVPRSVSLPPPTNIPEIKITDPNKVEKSCSLPTPGSSSKIKNIEPKKKTYLVIQIK